MPTVKSRYADAVAELARVTERLDEAQISGFMDAIVGARRVFLVGAGREGLSLRGFAMRLAHLGRVTHWIWDDTTPGLGAGDLLIMTSGSGEVGSLDYIFDRATEAGCRTAVITGDPSGVTARKANVLLWLPASVYKGKADVVPSSQPMGNLYEQALLILLDQVAMALAERLGETKETMEHRHRNVE
jgi:6-phospho-3-hexuloisomerase